MSGEARFLVILPPIAPPRGRGMGEHATAQRCGHTGRGAIHCARVNIDHKDVSLISADIAKNEQKSVSYFISDKS